MFILKMGDRIYMRKFSKKIRRKIDTMRHGRKYYDAVLKRREELSD